MALLRVALRARTITSDETALRRDLHSHSQSSSPTRLRGRRIIGPMNSEWKVSCSVWNANGGAPPWPRGRGRGSVDQICDWAPRDPPTARKIWAQFSNSSRSREAPHTLACGPDASESASKSERPRIHNPLSSYDFIEDARVRRRGRDPGSPAGEPERTRGDDESPGRHTARDDSRHRMFRLSCLMSTCRAARVRSSVLSCQLTQYLACQPFRC